MSPAITNIIRKNVINTTISFLIMSKEEREFQIELLKIQLKHQDISSSIISVLSISISIFVTLGVTFLSIGLNTRNIPLQVLAVICMLTLPLITYRLPRNLKGRAVIEEIDRELEEELAPIYEKFIKNVKNNNKNLEKPNNC